MQQNSGGNQSNQQQQSLQHYGQASSKESSSQQSPSKLSEYIGLPKALGVQPYVKSVYGWCTGGPSTLNQLPQSSSTTNVIPPTANYYKLVVHPSQTNNKETQNLISINKAQPAQTPHVKAALENSTKDVHTARREATKVKRKTIKRRKKNPFQYPKSEFTLNGNGNFWIPTDVIDIDVWYEKKKQICDMITETSYLNSGAYGSISTCKIKLLKQKFVCKTLKFIKLVDDKPFEILGQIEGIKAELKVLSEIDSQYIPKLFYAGFDEDCFYIIVTEFISGGILVHNQLNIHQKDVSFIGMELARAIQCLHDRNLSHGDLTPSNVALTPDGHVVLIDFGNSRDISKPLILPRCHESFVAPEVAKGLPANSAADWWSFGCILVSLLQTDEPINIKKKTGISLADELISKLLVDNPNERLTKVSEHPYLQTKNPTFKPGELLVASKSQPSEEIDKRVFLPLGQDDPLGSRNQVQSYETTEVLLDGDSNEAVENERDEYRQHILAPGVLSIVDQLRCLLPLENSKLLDNGSIDVSEEAVPTISTITYRNLFSSSNILNNEHAVSAPTSVLLDPRPSGSNNEQRAPLFRSTNIHDIYKHPPYDPRHFASSCHQNEVLFDESGIMQKRLNITAAFF